MNLATPGFMSMLLELALDPVPSPEPLQTAIGRFAGELEQRFAGIERCRVRLELPDAPSAHPCLYRLVIELDVPAGRLVVSRVPDDNAAHADLLDAVRDAFAAMRRQLEDYVRFHHPQDEAAPGCPI
jgi:hypothetical protein